MFLIVLGSCTKEKKSIRYLIQTEDVYAYINGVQKNEFEFIQVVYEGQSVEVETKTTQWWHSPNLRISREGITVFSYPNSCKTTLTYGQ